MFKILLFFINLVLLAAGQRLIDCGFNESIALNAGEWFRYESVDFPKSIALGPSNCRFTLNMSSTTQLWITPVNAFLGYLGVDDWNPINSPFIDVDTNTKIQTYLTKGLFNTMSLIVGTNVDSSKWYGFQAIGIAVDSFFGCPFNNISISLTDSKTIIPVSSTYYSLNSNETKYLPKTDCTWNFHTTNDYKFKLVLRFSNFSPNETFYAQTDGGQLTNLTFNYNIGEADAQYFDGANLTLKYSAPQRTPKYYFYAVVTVVKKTPAIDKNCNNNTYDLVNGYSNFESCSTNYKQQSMTQTRIKVDLAAETCCDKLIIESGNETLSLKPNMIVHVNTNIENYNINFTTDGSIVQGGYKLTSVNYSCKNVTEDFVIPCDGSTITVGYETGYCNNMHVVYTFTMEKFCTSGLNWQINYDLRQNSNDKILYYIDDVFQSEINNWNSGSISSATSGPVPFKIEFFSISDTDSPFPTGNWLWNFVGYSKPSIQNIAYNLNANIPILYFNLEQLWSGQELTVTVDPQFTLEMFVAVKSLSNLTNFLLFESADHTNFVGPLSNSSLFITNTTTFLAPKYPTKSNVLTIQQILNHNTVTDAALYFRIAPTLSSICTTNNVYRVPEDYGNITFPVSSSETCPYSIITYGYRARTLGIESLSTNTSDLTQISGGSFNQTLPYFNFNAATANDYKHLKLYGSVFNFIIPKNAETTISSGTKFNGGAYNTTQTLSYLNEINLITSPNYGDMYSGYINQTFLTTVNSSFIQNSFLLSVINQNVTSSADLYIRGYGSNNIDLKSQNSPLWINSSSFTVVYRDSMFSRFLISYQLVESEGGPTVSPSTTTQRNGASENLMVLTMSILFIIKLILLF